MTTTPVRRRRPRAVVTGGAGFLGSWTCEALLDAGADVLCVDSFVTGAPGNLAGLRDRPGLTVLEQDLTLGLPVSGPVDLVLHLASPASPLDYHRLAVETMLVGSQGTLHALRLAERTGARFVLASTSEVYGDPQVHPQPEDYWGHVNPIGPRSVYDEAKRYAEALTQAFRTERGVRTGIVRIFNTYGPRMRADDGRAVPVFVTQALAGRPLTVAGDGSQTRSLCFVDDTVAGLLAMAASDEPGPVNIGNPHEMSMLDLACTIRDLVGSTSTVRFVDLPVDDPRVRCPDTARAAARLGWRPAVPVDEGLRRTIAWFRAGAGTAAVSAG